MKNISLLTDKVGEKLTEIGELSKCLFKVIESGVENCEDISYITPLAKIVSQKTDKILKYYDELEFEISEIVYADRL